MTELLDPTSERAPAVRERSPRLASVAGRTVGLLDISKPRGDVFLDRLEELLTPWTALKPASAVVVRVRSRETGADARFGEALQEATGVWFDDGGQEVEYYWFDRIQYPVRLDDDDFNPDKLRGKR